ncbi:MAG: hypothetical protein NC390_02295 [Fusobacterium sp.]|nr:hypothetical protein [Fusobacterium sp.]
MSKFLTHYFVELDNKAFNELLSHKKLKVKNQNNELLNQKITEKDKDILVYILYKCLDDETLNDSNKLWNIFCLKCEVLIFKEKRHFESLEQYEKNIKIFSGKYLCDFKEDNICLIFKGKNLEEILPSDINSLNAEFDNINIINISLKNHYANGGFNVKTLIILLKLRHKILYIKYTHRNHFIRLQNENQRSIVNVECDIPDWNLIYEIACELSSSLTLKKKLQEIWTDKDDKIVDYFTYFNGIYKENLDMVIEQINHKN